MRTSLTIPQVDVFCIHTINDIQIGLSLTHHLHEH